MGTDPVPRDPAATPKRRRGKGGEVDRRLETKTLAALIVGALIIAFAAVNSQKVQIDFLVASAAAPLALALVIAMLLGFVLGVLVSRRARRSPPDRRP